MKFIYIVIGIVIVMTLLDIEEKLKKLLNKDNKNKLDLANYLNKDVYIILNNENVTDYYLFTSVVKTMGKILDYDDNWFVFRYYNKSTKKKVTQYLRISDLESVNIIK